jgi:hypothetical protein
MRHLLLFVLLTSTVGHAGDWPIEACRGITEVATRVNVSLNDYGNKNLQLLMEDRIKTTTHIRLRSAGISVDDVSITAPALYVSVSLGKVSNTPATMYYMSVELMELVVIARTGRSTFGTTGSGQARGWAGSAILGQTLNEELDAQLNEFINCVLEARDKAGELKPPPKAKKKATVASDGK